MILFFHDIITVLVYLAAAHICSGPLGFHLTLLGCIIAFL